jgi:hypothetical protein
MSAIANPDVADVFDAYPERAREKLLALRRLILETATETEGVDDVDETLSWGEPAYKTASGSTVRIDWKADHPDQYAMYFTCTTSLVETFREVHGDLFQYEGNRALVFDVAEDVPEDELRHCISLALTYHDVKHLPLLGA